MRKKFMVKCEQKTKQANFGTEEPKEIVLDEVKQPPLHSSSKYTLPNVFFNRRDLICAHRMSINFCASGSGLS